MTLGKRIKTMTLNLLFIFNIMENQESAGS